jgi:hypothetical protein
MKPLFHSHPPALKQLSTLASGLLVAAAVIWLCISLTHRDNLDNLDPAFKSALADFLHEADALANTTAHEATTNLTFKDYSTQLASVRSSYEKAASLWPPGWQIKAHNELSDALGEYESAKSVWDSQLTFGCPPNVNAMFAYAEAHYETARDALQK